MCISVESFNQAPADDAAEMIRVWAPIDSWAKTIIENRPYVSSEELAAFADRNTGSWSDDEVLAALASHARLGQKPKGTDANSEHSRNEQSSMGQLSDNTRERLAELQDEYLERFGHIFLIRAAGRSAEQILSALEVRLERTPEEEIKTAADELRQIAMLRLEQAFSAAK